MSINETKKPKKGRPSVDSEAVNLRLTRDVLVNVDDYRRDQQDIPNRPEAIRRLLAIGIRSDKKLKELLGDMGSICDGDKLNRGKLENALRFVLHDDQDIV